jgi:predicted permease
MIEPHFVDFGYFVAAFLWIVLALVVGPDLQLSANYKANKHDRHGRYRLANLARLTPLLVFVVVSFGLIAMAFQ